MLSYPRLSAMLRALLSHHHWDHVGDMSRLPKETKLVVGPGFMGAFTPGFPVDEHSEILVSDYE